VDGAGQPFAPSRSRQVEVGAKFLPAGAPLAFTAAVFSLEKDNVVSYDPETFEPRQIGRVRSRGLELEGKAELLARRLVVTAAYTVVDMEVLASADASEVGQTPILVPRQSASLWMDYALKGDIEHGLVGGLGIQHTGERWNDTANTSSEPPATVLDAALRYDTGAWRIGLNVSNLLDKRYYASRAWDGYHDAPRRTVVLGAKYRF
jgi:iron complex outermembrane recepter protein